ncbi:MAG: thiamine pyrophosphate protein binding domain protein, partial [Actinomycetia bacterium]|nr:thiamine pyrophosphate protein binding domain protein [Actinomycetes bacterium]
GRPAVIDVVTDPDVPPMPPHVSLEEARNLVHAIWKGDPDAADILRVGFKEKLQELIHR